MGIICGTAQLAGVFLWPSPHGAAGSPVEVCISIVAGMSIIVIIISSLAIPIFVINLSSSSCTTIVTATNATIVTIKGLSCNLLY